jgi:hypothetical protein
MQAEPLEKALHDTLLALGQDHLQNLIVVGGWCPYLYSRYVWRIPTPPMLTMDIDFAVKNMTPDRFSEPVYKTLLAAKLIPRRIDMDDENRSQFSCLAGKVLVPIDFITTTTVLPRGQEIYKFPYVECSPIPEMAVALRSKPVVAIIPCSGKPLEVQILSPAAFIIIKSNLLHYRENSKKIGKDFASVAFILRYAPDPAKICQEVAELRSGTYFKSAGRLLAEALSRKEGVGVNLLAPFYREWLVPENQIQTEIGKNFKPLLETFNKVRDRQQRNQGHGMSR